MIKMLKEATRPALLTFIGTALIKLATGVIGIWGTINIYFLSYFKNHGYTITPLTNSIIFICAIIPASFAVLISTTLTKRFGYKRVIRISALVFATTPYMINYHLNLFTLGFCFLLVPVSAFAISSIPILNCLWSQFPKDLNKVSGSAVLFFAVGMVIWNLIFLAFTNPSNATAIIDQTNQAFFSSQISQRVFKASNVMFLLSGLCFVTGSFLISKKIDDQEYSGNKLSQQSPPNNNINAKTEQVMVDSVPPISPTETVPQKTIKLKDALKDKKFIILFLISFLVPLYHIYLVLYMKLTFMPIINDDHYLAYCSVILTISAIIGAPFWGYVGDKKGFKTTLIIVVSIDLGIKIFGLFCQKKWNLIILYFFLGFNDKGILTIIGPGLIQIFGLEMATELIPYKGISLFLAYVTVPLTQIILSSVWDYRLILVIFVLCSSGAVCLAYNFYSKISYIPMTAHLEQCRKLQQEKNIELYMP